jgi:hypothetical protein
MRRFKRSFAAGTVAVMAALALALPVGALAGGYCPPKPPPPENGKCNSGNGNGSEFVVSGTNCIYGDPGQSFFQNRGGDEVPTYGGFENPGGNNTPG